MGESYSIFAGGGKYTFKNFEDAKAHKETFHAMRLRRKEVKKLFYKFRKWDKKNQKTLDQQNFVNFVDIESRGLSRRVFRVFDENNDSFVDFLEFILGCWNYCTSSKHTLALLAFDLYDSDTKGFMSPADMEEMLKDFFGTNFLNNRHAKEALKKVIATCGNHDPPRPGITVKEFQNFARSHQTMLYPVFSLQQRLQRRTLGLSRWNDIAERTAAVRRAGTFGLRALKSNIEEGNAHPIGKSQPSVPKARRMSGDEGNLMGTLHSRRASMRKNSTDSRNDTMNPVISARRKSAERLEKTSAQVLANNESANADGFSNPSVASPTIKNVSAPKPEDTFLLDYLDDVVDEVIDEGRSFHENEQGDNHDSTIPKKVLHGSLDVGNVYEHEKSHNQSMRKKSMEKSGHENHLPQPLSSRRRSSASFEQNQNIQARRLSSTQTMLQQSPAVRRKSSTQKMTANHVNRTHLVQPSPSSNAVGSRRSSWASEDGTPRIEQSNTSKRNSTAAARRGSEDKYFLVKK